MNTLSFGAHAFQSPLLAPSRAYPSFRPLQGRSGGQSQLPHSTRNISANRFSLAEDRVSSGLALGLFALILPAVACAFYQLWQLVGGETLNHAVRAFAP